MIQREDLVFIMSLTKDEEEAIQAQFRADDNSEANRRVVMNPREHDVLLGKSREALSHPGNGWYRILIQEHREKYQTAKRNVDKALIVQMILDEVARAQGRFLRLNEEKQRWEIITTKEAYDKVAHALRNRKRKRRHTAEQNIEYVPQLLHPPSASMMEDAARGLHPLPIIPVQQSDPMVFVRHVVEPRPITYGSPLPTFDAEETLLLQRILADQRPKE